MHKQHNCVIAETKQSQSLITWFYILNSEGNIINLQKAIVPA